MKGSNLPIILLVVVIFGLFAWLILNLNKGFDWYEGLSSEGKEPYDLELFKQLIEEASPGETTIGKEPVTETLENKQNINYLFIGHRFLVDTTQVNALMDFVSAGNDAFICAYYFSDNFINALEKRGHFIGYVENESEVYEEDLDEDYKDIHNSVEGLVKFGKPKGVHDYRFVRRDEYGTDVNYWNFFADTLEYDKDIQIISSIKTHEDSSYRPNFYRINMGKGHLLLHSQPLLFTNYFINEDWGFKHANQVIRELPDRPLIWDNYHQNYYAQGEGFTPGHSPLRFIIDHKALRYAWYVLLAGCLLFIVFRGKRQQRIIPLLPRVENTSIAFAKSLGSLYYQSDNGSFLAVEMMKLFNNFNRRKYRINRKKTDEYITDSLAQKAKVPEELLNAIFKAERQIIYNPSAKMKDVFILYHLLQEYYQKARK